MPIPDVFGLKGMAIGCAIAFAAGGWTVNKVHFAVKHKQEVQRLEGVIEEERAARAAEQILLKEAETREAGLQLLLNDSRRTLADREDYIGELIRRQPKKTETIIREGEKIGNEAQINDPWIRFAWPDSLRDYANGREAQLPASAENGMGGHYPRSNP